MTHVFVNILQITEEQKHLNYFEMTAKMLLYELIAWQKKDSHNFQGNYLRLWIT